MVSIESVEVGSIITCRYPRKGTSNMLANRKGEVTFNGVSAKGIPYITVRTNECLRNFRANRMVDLQVTSCNQPQEMV